MELGGVTSKIVSLGLDAAHEQHKLISQNIANANSVDYMRSYVDFGELFDSVSDSKGIVSFSEAVSNAEQRLRSGVVTQQTEHQVSLEQEMAAMAKNTLYYQALLTGLSERGGVLKMAISEGK